MAARGSVVKVGGGRYELVSRLGNGQFGTVWLAKDLDEGDEVAVKLFKSSVRPDQVLVEAGLQRRVSDHHHVVSLRNVDIRTGGAPILAMEYIPGGSVHARTRTERPSLVLAVRWTRNVLEALANAHSEGVIHRDVKPKNVLLDSNDRALLSDFGVSEDTFRRVIAHPGVYTPLVAPELTRGVATSPRSDVYAVGVFLYHLLVGDYPFADVAEAIADRWTRPHRINLQVPMALTRIVEKAVAVDPADRYQDAGEMLKAVAGLTIRGSWRYVADPAYEDKWESDDPSSHYEVTIAGRARGGFEIRARHTGGGRLARRRHEVRSSLAQARQVARGWLLELVEGGSL